MVGLTINKALAWLEYIAEKSVRLEEVEYIYEDGSRERFLVPSVILEKLEREVLEMMKEASNPDEYQAMKETLWDVQHRLLRFSTPWGYAVEVVKQYGIPKA